MRIYKLLITGAVFGLAVAAFPAAARAQDSTLHKAGAAMHHTLKKTGNAVKRDAKKERERDPPTLRAAGNKTKTVAGNVTGVHKVGGSVGAAAQKVSRVGKSAARSTKAGVKSSRRRFTTTCRRWGILRRPRSRSLRSTDTLETRRPPPDPPAEGVDILPAWLAYQR